ncbi:MAG: methyltransferase [Allobranchiibius sp.]
MTDSEQQHYFTARPAGDTERRTINIPLAGTTYPVQVAGGVFSGDRIDQGTEVLLRQVPAPATTGTFLDLGCGWGPLALTMALRSPAATVYAVDVNERALDLTRRNAEAVGVEVRAGLPDSVPSDTRFDLIWSNPPIRIGKKALHELLAGWLPKLTDTGAAYLVVQRNLGSDSLQRWLGEEFGDLVTTRHASEKGYRLLRVSRAD